MKSVGSALFSLIMSVLLDTFNCEWDNEPPWHLKRNSTFECLKSNHFLYMVIASVAILIYYPISAFMLPNFQFIEKKHWI